MKTGTANLLLLLAGAIWGFGFLAQKKAMDDIGPILFVGLRFLLAGFAVLPLALREVRQKPGAKSTIRNWASRFAGLGIVFFAGMGLQQTGLLTTSVTNAGFLTTLYVVFVPVLALLLFRERPLKVVWFLAFLSVLGVYFLSSADLGSLTSGDLLVLAGAFVWAFHVILIGRMAAGSDLPYSMAAAQFFVCGILGCATQAVLILSFAEQVFPSWQQLGNAAPEVVYAGLFSGAVAFTLQAVAQRYTTPSIAAILMASESLFAAVLGAVFLDERLELLGYVGCSLIFGSIVATEIVSIRAENLRRPVDDMTTKSDSVPVASSDVIDT